MAAYLEISNNTHSRKLPCGSLVTVGRDIGSTLQLDDPLVSRLHALIRHVGQDSYYLLDAGSRNGTFLNSRRVSTPTLLKSEDAITFGEATVTFYYEPDIDPAMATQTQVHLGETISHVRLEIQPVTILVADIRGYTAMTELMPIASLSKMMTSWFSSVQETVEARHGRVDKFIGDSVMALWYHGQNVERETILDCLEAAREISQHTRSLRETSPDLKTQLDIAVGINTGMAAVGVGADNTAMGDAVNLAFRLESACRTENTELILSKSTYQHLPESLWKKRATMIKVRGKSQPIDVCSLTFDALNDTLATRST